MRLGTPSDSNLPYKIEVTLQSLFAAFETSAICADSDSPIDHCDLDA
jgi:hypothetical protein